MIKRTIKTRVFGFIAATVMLATTLISPVQLMAAPARPIENCAISVAGRCMDIDYRTQDINHYDPTVCGEGGDIGGDNRDYEGNIILTQAQLDNIKRNQPFYETAAKAEKIPWQMIAVIHLRETNLSRVNPGNGQGLYQDSAKSNSEASTLYVSDPNGAEVSDDNFQKQTNWAAQFIKGKSSNPSLLTNGNDDEIKDTFFGYNGRAGLYKTQATSLGFANAYEGSPYVMNRADSVRDPLKHADDKSWGQITSDGADVLTYPANKDYGAYVVYNALKASTGSSSPECSKLGGPLRTKIVTLAEQELAKWESGQMSPGFRPSDATSFSKYTDNIGADWCAWFTSWILKEAGNPVGTPGRQWWSYVDDFTEKGPTERGFVVHQNDGQFKPQPGDFAIYNNGSHINIVVGYSDNGQMITIGGNQGAGPNGNWQSSKVNRNIGYGDGATQYVSVD
jgi:hypothetical protein